MAGGVQRLKKFMADHLLCRGESEGENDLEIVDDLREETFDLEGSVSVLVRCPTCAATITEVIAVREWIADTEEDVSLYLKNPEEWERRARAFILKSGTDKPTN